MQVIDAGLPVAPADPAESFDTVAWVEQRGSATLAPQVAVPQVAAPRPIATTLRPTASGVFDNWAEIATESWWRIALGPLLVIAIALLAPRTDTWSVIACAWLIAVIALLAVALQLRSHRLHIGSEGVSRASAFRRPWHVSAEQIHAARLVALVPRRLLPWTRGVLGYRLLLIDVDGQTIRRASLWGYLPTRVAAALNDADIACLSRVERLEANRLRGQHDGAVGVIASYSTVVVLSGLLIVLLLAGTIGARLVAS